MKFLQKCTVLAFTFFICASSTAQLVVQNGSVLSTNGNATITLQDLDLVDNGSIGQSAGDGRFVFSGVGNNSISGSSNPSFDVLEIAKAGTAKISLSLNIQIASSIHFTAGLIDLNNNNIFLQSTALLIGENQNSRVFTSSGGYIEISNDLNAPSSINAGNLGATISSGQNLGTTIIRRGHDPQVNGASIGSSILRYYDIIPTNDASLNATLRVGYFDTELNGLDKNNLVIWKSVDNVNWSNIGFDSRDAIAGYVEKSGINSFSRWTLSTASNPLPIVYSGFAIECLNDASIIGWQTSQEQNSSHFEVEKSIDGGSWKTIASIPAAVNSVSPINYSYTDVSISSGRVDYRIAEYDLDGAIAYSSIKPSTCFSTETEVRVFPNPVSKILWVSLPKPISSALKLEFMDVQGRVQVVQRIMPGISTNIKVDMTGLAAGVYFLKLEWDNGDHVRLVKVLKQE